MEHSYLQEAAKSHYGYADVFDDAPWDWIKAFVETEYNIGIHSQAFFEINIITKGHGNHYIEQQRMPVARGDIFIIPPNIRHGYSSEGELDVFHILIHHQFFSQYDEELKALPFFFVLFNIEPVMRVGGNMNLHLIVNDGEFVRINELLELLQGGYETRGIHRAVMRNGVALGLIARMCALYEEHEPRQILEEKIRWDSDFMKSLSVIYDHYSQKLTIHQLARISNLSRTAYISKFNRIMHTTPARFILLYRMKKSKELLLQSDRTVFEIALETGFYDASHFTRLFTGLNGCSPLSWRKSNR